MIHVIKLLGAAQGYTDPNRWRDGMEGGMEWMEGWNGWRDGIDGGMEWMEWRGGWNGWRD